jgi:putative transposase
VRYAFIEGQRLQHKLTTLCRVLHVSKAGFYDWRERQRQPSPDLLALETAARAAHERGRHTYGAKRLRSELLEAGYPRSLSAVKRLRKRLALRCKQRRQYKATTDSNHHLPVAPNVLNRQFECSAPNQVWVMDITYVATQEGWLYLAAVKDLFTCKIVGWSMSERMKTELVSKALFMAVQTHKPAPGLIAHSDRGSQYASAEYRRLLTQFGMVQSMSRKGNCWDNAPMESWFASLKKEELNLHHFRTRAQARSTIFDYIEVFYNKLRRHSKIDNMSPANFERKWRMEQEQKAA